MISKNATDAETTHYLLDLIETIVRDCPRRQGTSDDERRAQELLSKELEACGLEVHSEPFAFNDNLYANVALHSGAAVLGTLVSGVLPQVGLALHALAGGSYLCDSTRRGYLLRRLLRFLPSQNIVAVASAKEAVRLRLVFVAHSDAAFTGWLFDPKVVARFSGGAFQRVPGLNRPMALVTFSQLALAGCDMARCLLGPLAAPLRPLEWALTVPSVIALLFNLQIVLRNEVVPGANDDLSGCAALPVLAARLLPDKPDDVELVFAVTGCEECSLGGADALARSRKNSWDKSKTIVIGLDGLSGAELRYLEDDSELLPRRVPAWLESVIAETSAAEPSLPVVRGYTPPVGGTDLGAFLAHGFEGVCFVAFDEAAGSPPNYHLPTDTPTNLNAAQMLSAIHFIEQLSRSLIAKRRTGGSCFVDKKRGARCVAMLEAVQTQMERF